MGVYINGMKLPTENQNLKSIKLIFRWDPEIETWYCFDDNVVGPDRYKEVVAVPDHGDLIDRDAIHFRTMDYWDLRDAIDDATVVIQADKERE